ncbi:uncharacterized protein LOC135157074 [Lytechinus pictus]|uniref:uncharacterized protein LOC135157074 n=1 Tax=Lytechinus pictus TaxID=7653 RepID=UPI0030B9F8C1
MPDDPCPSPVSSQHSDSSSSSTTSSVPTSPSRGGQSSDSYKPSDESDSSSSEEEREPDEMRYCMGKKYVVFDEQLNDLFYRLKCKSCSDGHIAELKKYTVGTMLVVNVLCVCGSLVYRWQSQPTIGRQPVGNLLLSASIMFTGKTYEDFKVLADLFNLQFISDTTFYDIHNKILLPVIHTFYTQDIQDAHEEHKNRPLSICGDGRCDSPGYNAKYCTYTCIDLQSNKILGMSLVHVSEATSSVAMEKVGCRRVLDFLLASLDVSVFATDRHASIAKMMREVFPQVCHQYDIWHVTKSIKKKLIEKAKQKDNEVLWPWTRSITNHLWWSTENCDEDEVMLREMIQSVTHHITDIHSWNSAEKFHECEHEELTPEETEETKWLEPGSKPHEAVQSIVFNQRLMKDTKQMTKACHTGAIESYHSLYLKYCPKRKHFFYPAMLARAELAVLDHNANTGREQATVKRERTGTAKKGALRFRYVWSKSTKEWVLKRIPEDKNYAYLWDMLVAVLQVKAGNFDLKQPQYPILPQNIAPIPRPPPEELIERATSRFSH